MNTDIRISVSFKDHRKRKKLKMLIGPGSTDYLIDLWISTAMNHPSGKLFGMDETDIALDSGWEGKPEVFVDALVKSGFLDLCEEGYCLHDWDEHQAYVIHADARKEKAKAAAAKRWAKKPDATSILNGCYEHSTSMPVALLNDDFSNAPSPTPTPTPIPSPNPTPTPSPKDNARFTPPTYQEVLDYCTERNNLVDAQKFVDFYASKGWLVGKTKMKDWKASVRTWEKGDGRKVTPQCQECDYQVRGNYCASKTDDERTKCTQFKKYL